MRWIFPAARPIPVGLPVLAGLVLLALGCSDGGSNSSGLAARADYLAYDGPEQLMANFAMSWKNMDIEEYSERVLHNGQLAAPDGECYREFTFHFFSEGDSTEESTQPYGNEVSNAGRMFSGDAVTNGTPGVESITLELVKDGDWVLLEQPGTVRGDPHPAGTWRCIYNTTLALRLKGMVPGTEIDGFSQQDRAEFYVIPVLVDAGTADERSEYRLWKWRDLGD